jgi:mycoredoxin
MAVEEESGMTQPLTMYTTPWCGYCRRLKSQLAREGIEITEVDIERDPAAADHVMAVNGGYQTVPTLLFADGSTLTNPSVRAVKQRLEDLAVIR